VILGQNAPVEELAAAFRQAAGASICRGFAVGRTISHAPSREWLAGRIDGAALAAQVRANFLELVRAWREARAPRREAAPPIAGPQRAASEASP
jgi:5-dehydro-2-deoxygluconokinase